MPRRILLFTAGTLALMALAAPVAAATAPPTPQGGYTDGTFGYSDGAFTPTASRASSAASRPLRALLTRSARRRALASGTSHFALPTAATSDWRLVGRRLTVRLGESLIAGVRGGAIVRAHCGDLTALPERIVQGIEQLPWADVTRATARVVASTRVIRLTLRRDLAAKTNFCELSAARDGYLPGTRLAGLPPFRDFYATMSVRRGHLRRCVPGPRERIVFATAKMRVTLARGGDDAGYTDGYRACLRPNGPWRPIEALEGGGGAGGGDARAEQFTSAGTWLAWTDTQSSHASTDFSSSVRHIDLSSGHEATIDTAPGTVRALALDSTGTTAWLLEPSPIIKGNVPALETTVGPTQLLARTLHGPRVALDATAESSCPGATPCHSDTAIANIAVDGRTVTWTHAGSPRSATLP